MVQSNSPPDTTSAPDTRAGRLLELRMTVSAVVHLRIAWGSDGRSRFVVPQIEA